MNFSNVDLVSDPDGMRIRAFLNGCDPAKLARFQQVPDDLLTWSIALPHYERLQAEYGVEPVRAVVMKTAKRLQERVR